jgi:hypothetical protein
VRAGRVRAYDAEKAVWGRCVGAYIAGWVRGEKKEPNGAEEGDAKAATKGEGWEVAQAVRAHYWDLERVRSSFRLGNVVAQLLIAIAGSWYDNSTCSFCWMIQRDPI